MPNDAALPLKPGLFYKNNRRTAQCTAFYAAALPRALSGSWLRARFSR
ncbi:MAG: hypothetical protein WBR13_05800 [Allosphingosinicella sp.]